MKNEKIKEFLTKLAQEEGFKLEFLKLREKVEKEGFSKKDNEKFISECILPWSKKLGYHLSKKDFTDFDRTQKPTKITGLTTEQLENVSGGGLPMLFALFAMFGSTLAGGINSGSSTSDTPKKGKNSFSTSLVEYSPTGVASQDYYNYYYGTTPADFGDGTTTDAPTSTALVTTSGQPQTSVSDYNKTFARSSAAVDSGENVVQMLKDIREGASAPAGGKPMSTALITTPGHPQTSVKNYNEHFARSSVPAAFNSGVTSIVAQPTPAGDAFSPINPSTWNEIPEQSGSAGSEQPQTSVKGNMDTTGIASVDNYLVGEGEILSNGGQTPVDFEMPQNASVEQVQTETEDLDDLNPFALNQNMFPTTSTPSITMPEIGGEEQAPGLFSRLGVAIGKGLTRGRDLIYNTAEYYMNNYGETSVEEYDRRHGETSAEDYEQNYARTSPGDYNQNYVRSARAQPHTFSTDGLSSENGVHTEKLGNPLSVPDGVSADLSGSFNRGSSQQPRLAGNVGNGSTDTSSTISLDTPKGLTISRTSSGDQEIVNMMKDISAAENANFKAFEKHLEQSRGSGQVSIYTGLDSSGNAFSAAPAGGESMSKALVTTPGRPQASVNDYNENFARSSAAVDSGENVVQMLKDIKNPKASSDTPNTDIEPQVGLNPSPELLSGTPADAPPYQRGQVSIYTGLDSIGRPYSSAQRTNSDSMSDGGPRLKNDLKKFAAGIAIGLPTIVGVTGAIAAGSSGGSAQQNTNKTKETTSKAEEKKSVDETKRASNDIALRFMENLQKNNPEAFEYLKSLVK